MYNMYVHVQCTLFIRLHTAPMHRIRAEQATPRRDTLPTSLYYESSGLYNGLITLAHFLRHCLEGSTHYYFRTRRARRTARIAEAKRLGA